MTLPIKQFDFGELEITIKKYQELYKQKMFNFWKNHYIKVKQRKASLAYKYLSSSFEAWRQVKNKSKEYRRRVEVMSEKVNANMVGLLF